MNKIFAPFLPPWVETGLQPAFYDMESGTVLQQTARMYAKVQQLTRLFNELSEETKTEVENFEHSVNETVAEYIEKFTELKDFVDDYFDNLDVQEEINNKLDQMSEDGSLADIIRPYEPKDTYYFDTRFALLEGTLNGMQGGCMLPDKTMIQFSGSTKVYHIAVDGSILNSADFEHGHCNSACYCSKDGLVYVIEKFTGDRTKGTVYSIDPSTLDIVKTYSITDFPDELYGIVYLPEEDKFCFVNWWSKMNAVAPKMWKTNREFTITDIKTFDFKTITSANFGRIGKYLGVETLDQAKVLLFDEDMNFIQQSSFHQIIGDVWYDTETEWFDTVGNEVYIACACGQSAWPHLNDTYVYGVCNILENYEISRKGTAVTPMDEVYTVDHTATNLLRDGSSGKPFANIYEALNASLRTDKVSGNVTINMLNNPTDKYYFPLFTITKKYFIALSPNVPHDHINGIGVKGADVTFSRGITITPLDTKADPFSYLSSGGGDISLMGNFTCYGNISTSDSSTITVIGPEYGSGKFSLANDSKIDVTNFYGVIDNPRGTTVEVTGLKTAAANYLSKVIGCQSQLTITDGTCTVPRFSNNQMVRVRFQFTGLNNPQPEISLLLKYWTYFEIPVTYGEHYGIIKYDGNVLSMTGGTINRVVVLGIS